MASHNHFTDAYKQFKITEGEGGQYISDPGTGGTFDLRGHDNAYARVGAGTYTLPDNIPRGVRFTVFATGAVTLRTVASGTAVATLASGDCAECRPLTSTTWAATLYNATGTPAAHITVADAGTYTDRSTVETVTQGIMRDLQTIEFPVTSFAINGATPLAAFANNAAANPGLALADSKSQCIRVNNSSTQDQILWATAKIPLGALSATAAPVVNVLASKSGATLADATTFLVAAYVNENAQLHDAGENLGGTTSALTGNATAKTIGKCTLTMTSFAEAYSGPLPATGDAKLSIAISPTANTLNTDDLYIHRVWITYDQGTT